MHAGITPKKKVTYLEINQLLLDPKNPRLPEEVQGKGQMQLMTGMLELFDLEELALSMAQNGYFDEEPVVVIKKEATTKGKHSDEFYVVEGNRRVATIKLLLNEKLRKELGARLWPLLSPAVSKDLQTIPAIIYENRNEVLPYLGVRHIAGIKKWDSYAKARYVASMVKAGYTMDVIQQQIGDRQNSARKHYLCLKLADLVRDEFDFDVTPVKDNFSYLMLATGQGSIKRYLGLPVKLADTDLEKPVPREDLPKLKVLFSLIFGEGKAKPSVLSESRDITNYLQHVLASPTATDHLVKTRDLLSAYELSDGEAAMVMKYLATANKRLEAILGIVHRHKTPDVKEEMNKCWETVERIRRVLSEKQI
jgi:hypothetical protein